MDFLEGYLVGLGMIIFIGPVFFFLLSSTLKFGFKSGLLIVLGIIFSDIIYVLLCNYGLASFLALPSSNFLIAIIGGLLLVGIGLKYLLVKKIDIEDKIVLKPNHFISFFIKGFLVNFVNPFVLIVWMGIVKYAEESTSGNPIFFLIGILLGIFSTDLLKVVLAKQIKRFISPSILLLVYKIVGILLILFGIRMFFYFYCK